MDTNDSAIPHPADVDEPEPAASACLRAALRLRRQAADRANADRLPLSPVGTPGDSHRIGPTR